MISPCMLSSGPPELPWLIAASVWIASRIAVTPFGAWISRLMAETMPDVTVRSRPNGLPMATTPSPTLTSARGAERDRGQRGGGHLDLEQRDVGRGVGADHAGLDAVVVRERDVDRLRALDDVRVGDDVAVLVDHEAAALAVLLLDADDAGAGLVVDLADAQLAGDGGLHDRAASARAAAAVAACACWIVTVFVPPSSSAATPAAPAPPASRATSASGRKRRPKPPPARGRVLARRLLAGRLRGPGADRRRSRRTPCGSVGRRSRDRSAERREPNRDSTERGA